MNERQAWLAIAKEWDCACEENDQWSSAAGHIGVCMSIEALEDAREISESVAEMMREKTLAWVEKSCSRWISRPGGVFAAKLDQAGAKKRAAFCRLQAAKLAKKRGG